LRLSWPAFALTAAVGGAAMIVAAIGLGRTDVLGADGARVHVAGVARDGYPPTATPTPTPPPVAPRCLDPRALDLRGYVYLPASPTSFFRNCQVVSYYGYPGVPALGILGQFPSEDAMIAALSQQTQAFDDVNGPRSAIAAFHIIAASAQPDADGSALVHIPTSVIEHYIALASQHDFLVFLDLQMGHSTVDAEVSRVLPYLADRRVELALDPEWELPTGVIPGQQIGSMDASEINRAQEILQGVWDTTGGPNKILVIHQFTADMIRNKETLQAFPNVDLVIDMDGFGGRAVKLAHYQRFVVDDGAEHSGLKLFLDPTLDIDRMTPAEASEIDPQPDIVQFQ
jgi:hypothetical protein